MKCLIGLIYQLKKRNGSVSVDYWGLREKLLVLYRRRSRPVLEDVLYLGLSSMCLSHFKSLEAERLLQAYILIRKAFVLELSSMYQSHFKSVEARRLLQAYILMGKAVLLFFYRKVSDRFGLQREKMFQMCYCSVWIICVNC